MSQARDDRRFRKAFGDVDESVEIDALRRRVTTLLDEVTEGAFQLQLAGLFDDGYNIGDEAGNYLIKAGSAGDKKRLAELMLRAQQKKKFLDAMKILAERKSVSSDPEVLRAEARKVGPDEPSPEQLADLILALQKGFGIKELKGDLGPKALRRLFVLLDGLPKPNTASLDMISEIKRVGSDSTSWFRPSDKAIELNVESLKPDVTKSYETPSGEILKLPKFDAVALHEIGHALDHAVGFMATKGKDPEYGGWEETTTAGIVAALAGTFKASAAATVLGWEDAALGDLLSSCLKKGTINPDLFPDGQVPAAVASDPTVSWCVKMGLAGSRLQGCDKTMAEEHARGDVVFVPDDGDKWWRYHLDARNNQVSNYQFHARAEWFAEVFAVWALKQLPPSHPCYDELAALDSTQPLAKS